MKSNLKINLRTKLSIMFFFFISIPLISLGFLSYNMTSKSMKSTTEQQLRDLTDETAQSINQTINSVKSNIQIMSLNANLAKAAANDSATFSDALTYLSRLQKDHSSEIETLVITDASGKGIISNEKINCDLNLSDREYIQTALKGSPSESDVINSKATGNSVVAVCYPLTLDNKVVGTLLASIKFDSIASHAAKVKVGESGYAYMLNKSGVFISHPDKNKILKENLGNTDNTELKSIVDKMKTGKTDEGFYTYNNVYKYVRFTPVGNWIVAVTANYNEYMAPAIKIRQSTIITTVLAIVIAMFLAFLFTTKNIINPIKKLEDLMAKAGSGDLTVKSHIASGDEIETLGNCFNEMIEEQAKIIANVRSGSQELAASSEEISASAEEISSSTEEITATIQEVAANAEKQNNSIIDTSKVLVQLSSLVQIAQNKALTAKNNSSHTMDAAEEGRLKVNKTVEAIDNINKVSEDTAAILKVLNVLSSRVSGIVSTINNISNQTNLLALNAAIEAARAGEHGKGFTVVADEVRKLSEQTNVESNEIASLVNEMVVEINKAVDSMSFAKEAVENGVEVVKETDKSFISIIEAVEQIAQDINQIVDITKDEVASSDQILKLIDSVATITETTTANTQEVAASAEEQNATIETLAAASEQTSSMASNLNSLVEKFTI